MSKNSLAKTSQHPDIHHGLEALDIYRGECLKAEVLLMGKNHEAPIWKMSPFGVELDVTKFGENLKLLNEKRFDLQVKMPGNVSSFNGVVVEYKTHHQDKIIIGIRWNLSKKNVVRMHESSDRRKHERWLCPEEYLPTGTFPNPIRFNDFIVYRIKDISKNGIRFLTSLRNKCIIPGMLLDTTITFPMFGTIQTQIKIVESRIEEIHGKEHLSVGAKFVDPKNLDRVKLFSYYLLQFHPDVDTEKLKKDGMLPRSLSDKLDYSYVKSEEEFKGVIEVRKKAYAKAGKFNPENEEGLTDVFDARSRIIIAKHKGKIVGTLRVIFHESVEDLELQQFIDIRSKIPRSDQFVEVTRFCIDPDYQGGDLIFGMMKQLFLVMSQAERKWIVSFTSPKMFRSFYKKFGGKAIGPYFKHQNLNNVEQVPFLFDISKVLNGETVGPILWNIIVEDIYSFLYSNNFRYKNPISYLRISLYKCFTPLARFVKSRVERKMISLKNKR